MKKMFLLLLFCGLVVSMTGLLSSCTTWPSGIAKTREQLMDIEIGMSKSEVLDIMGEPYKREAYTSTNGLQVEFIIYLTEYTQSGSIPDSDTTPICFRDGKVTGWGRNYYESEKKRYEIEIRKGDN